MKRIAFLLAALLYSGTALAQTPIAETIATNLVIPWSLAFTPDGRLLVTERNGRVRLINVGSGVRGDPVIDISYEVAQSRDEAGLCGIAVDPNFTNNGYIYVYYTRQMGMSFVNRIQRLILDGNSYATEDVVLLDGIGGNNIHDGGALKFGPDGYLYATSGYGTTFSWPQDVNSLSGKILRMNADGTPAPGNPFPSSPYVYSYGHRNPQGLAWDNSGQLYSTEHGPTGELGAWHNDELNIIYPGANYGWPNCIGMCFDPNYVDPIRLWDPDTAAPGGVMFYDGAAFPQWAGNLFFGTLGLDGNRYARHLHRLVLDRPGGTGVVAEEMIAQNQFGRIRDVIEGPDGFIYFTTSNRDWRGSASSPGDDRVVRIRPQ